MGFLEDSYRIPRGFLEDFYKASRPEQEKRKIPGLPSAVPIRPFRPPKMGFLLAACARPAVRLCGLWCSCMWLLLHWR